MKLFDKNITIIQCNKDATITYASSAFCLKTNYDNNHVVGKKIYEFETIENNNISKIFKNLIKNRLTWSGELSFRKRW